MVHATRRDRLATLRPNLCTTPSDSHRDVYGDTPDVSKALRALVQARRVVRHGTKGGPVRPYTYAASGAVGSTRPAKPRPSLRIRLPKAGERWALTGRSPSDDGGADGKPPLGSTCRAPLPQPGPVRVAALLEALQGVQGSWVAEA